MKARRFFNLMIIFGMTKEDEQRKRKSGAVAGSEACNLTGRIDVARFCENKRCAYHNVVDSDRVEVKTDSGYVEIRNYLYRNSKDEEFNLCEICHKAIELVTHKP